MFDTVELHDPDGNVVYATQAGAEELRVEHGYTDVPPEAPQDPPEDDPPDDPEAPDELKVQDPAAPRGNASRDAWVAYAEQIGLQVADEDSREDIKAAVTALEQ